MSEPILLIEIYSASGKIDRFEAKDAGQAHLFTELIDPLKVFGGPPLTLSEDHCLTSYNAHAIVRIDLSGSMVPRWPYLGNAHSVTQVTEAYFDHASGTEELARRRLAAWQRPGVAQIGFTELTLVSGERIIWQIEMSSTEMVALDAASIAKRFFNAGGLHGRRTDGAVMIVNMAHVARLSFYPGPPRSAGRILFVTRQ